MNQFPDNLRQQAQTLSQARELESLSGPAVDPTLRIDCRPLRLATYEILILAIRMAEGEAITSDEFYRCIEELHACIGGVLTELTKGIQLRREREEGCPKDMSLLKALRDLQLARIHFTRQFSLGHPLGGRGLERIIDAGFKFLRESPTD